MTPLPLDVCSHFWKCFDSFVNVLGIQNATNKHIYTPRLMKTISIGKRLYLYMEEQMGKCCPECTCADYGQVIEKPHPFCQYFKTHPEEMVTAYWYDSFLTLGDYQYREILQGAIEEMKTVLSCEERNKEWTEDVNFSDILREMKEELAAKDTHMKKLKYDQLMIAYVKSVK